MTIRIAVPGFAAFAGFALLAAAPACAQTFTGPRVEAVVGLDQVHFDLSDVGSQGHAKQSAIGFGFAAGYDAAVGPDLIAGVEAAVTTSNADYASGDSTTGSSIHSRRDLTLAARLGTKVTPNTLLYGKVGYANLQTDTTNIVAGTGTDARRNLDGVLVGAGVEVAVSPHAYVKSEYRYTNYADGVSKNDILTGIGLRF